MSVARLTFPAVLFASLLNPALPHAPTSSGGEGEGFDAATVVATVNGQDIVLGELILLRANLPEEYRSIPPASLYEALLEQVVSETILEQQGKAADIDARADVALTIAAATRSAIADAALRKAVRDKLTDEVLQAVYQTRYVNAEPEREVRASHILVAEKAKAEELKAELDGGADFAALAAEHGTDGTKTRGGDLGWFAHGAMVPEFADAAFAMETGAVSDPVETQFGWHLILLAESRNKPVPSFEEVRGAIVAELTQQFVQSTLASLREGAEVSIADAPPPVEAILRDDLVTSE